MPPNLASALALGLAALPPPPEVGLHNHVTVLAASRALLGTASARQHRRQARRVQPHVRTGNGGHQQAQLRHVRGNGTLGWTQLGVADGPPRLQSQPQQEVDGNRQAGAAFCRAAGLGP